MAAVILPPELMRSREAERLTDEARRLLTFLVSLLPDLNPNEPRTCVRYKEAHDKLQLRQKGTTYGESLKKQGLAALADWTAATGKPAITGMIVDGTSLMPAKGYYKPFGRSVDDFEWWRDQLRRSKEFDWAPYLPFSIEGTPTPIATDIEEPAAQRVETRVYRVLRDTELALRVKKAHNYECQICGQTIVLKDGTRYAEAHHIRPLGRPHDGPDAQENILCLCPNHHVELDYGVRAIAREELRVVEGHNVGTKYLKYHNDHIAANGS
ncbi:HNH endonuclease [Bradyrhizobium erythrophlei]|uniref:HNH endonuclease n=1 Tax=Bradyrhizobium erythrophlei TaxID=1437360 RepID=A0A1H5AQ81_9BRAD|nr:HNH endonuclease [Bradyrhizobium erythrophlei]SED43780.1 HNH endonuclease [Bradyrhizobium erythrophlei]